MENILLQFTSRAQLLGFLKETELLRCFVDLENLTLSAEFTENDLELAISQFGAFVFAENVIY